MLISIVTVCRNCEANIAQTVESLLAQSFADYEYVVVDGASTDRTLEILEQYRDRMARMRVCSEPDQGIYDAMNKGVRRACGDYVYFLNAGDALYDSQTLSRVAEHLRGGLDLYYGDMWKNGGVERYPARICEGELVLRERMICHQAIFARRQLLERFPFDLRFRICADRDWLIRILRARGTYRRMDGVIVARYDEAGVSSCYANFETDSLQIARKYRGAAGVALVRLKRLLGRCLGHRRA